MDIKIKDKFNEIWANYFPNAELPIGLYYADDTGDTPEASVSKGWRCFIGDLIKVRNGNSLCFCNETIGCGKRFLGFTQDLRPDFDHFLSCGIEGKVKGERYKKSPEIVKDLFSKIPPHIAPKKYLIAKRWDLFTENDNPEIVVFFATPDVLSGLFTLSGFEETDQNCVISPFGAGCATIISYPYQELAKENPRAVLGMFDVSARPMVPNNVLSFSIPWPKFVKMIHNAEESFLITEAWKKVQSRMAKTQG